jgi:hypothetical protein
MALHVTQGTTCALLNAGLTTGGKQWREAAAQRRGEAHHVGVVVENFGVI